MANEDCIFCKIIKKEIESLTVYEDDFLIAFLDINPQGKGHTLVVPKEHRNSITDFPEATAANILKIVYRIASVLTKLTCTKSIIINNGNAGSPLTHAYFQLIPFYGSPEEQKKSVDSIRQNQNEVNQLIVDMKKSMMPVMCEKPMEKIVVPSGITPAPAGDDIRELREEIEKLKARVSSEVPKPEPKKGNYNHSPHWI